MVLRTIAFLAIVVVSIRPASADQAILGHRLQVSDPKPGVDPTKRKVSFSGKESPSPDVIVGDPSQTGAELAFFLATSGTGDTQDFFLPAAGWKATRSGFVYEDTSGAYGQVRAAQLERSSRGTFQIKAVALGRAGGLSFPPLPATHACVFLTILDGDTYHVSFPAPPAATIKRNDTTAFVIRDPLSEGYCYPPPPTTTTTTSLHTTTTTNPNAFCGDGVRDPGEQCDGGPACTPDCLQEIPSCCSATNQCLDAPLFSLQFYLMQYCASVLPGSSPMPGGICAPDGSCAQAPIDPVPVCCQLAGSCYDQMENSTSGLWFFQNVCRGAQGGSHVINAVCGSGGACVSQ